MKTLSSPSLNLMSTIIFESAQRHNAQPQAPREPISEFLNRNAPLVGCSVGLARVPQAACNGFSHEPNLRENMVARIKPRHNSLNDFIVCRNDLPTRVDKQLDPLRWRRILFCQLFADDPLG